MKIILTSEQQRQLTTNAENTLKIISKAKKGKKECLGCKEYRKRIDSMKRQGAKVVEELEDMRKELKESDDLIKELRKEQGI